ncbi:MAG: hypothetical protein WDN46_07950 [Methylocella sp.]
MQPDKLYDGAACVRNMRPVRRQASVNSAVVRNEVTAKAYGVALASLLLMLCEAKGDRCHGARKGDRAQRAFHIHRHVVVPPKLKISAVPTRRVHLA